MCNTCGCALTTGNARQLQPGGSLEGPADGQASIEVMTALLQENDRQAARNRAWLDQHGVLAVNLMSSPGAGKTALLEATIRALDGELQIGVIEGDLETENDARRIRRLGVPAVQITTGQACHLDAHMVHEALHQLDLARLELLVIENVGNLVCPASFDLGQHANVTLLSVPEGDDKPSKYPVMFRAADLVVVSKCDLLEALRDFDPEAVERRIRRLASPAPLLQVSARVPDSIGPWLVWLRHMRNRHHSGERLLPRVPADGPALHAMS